MGKILILVIKSYLSFFYKFVFKHDKKIDQHI